MDFLKCINCGKASIKVFGFFDGSDVIKCKCYTCGLMSVNNVQNKFMKAPEVYYK
jgi:hypothetical protein